MIIANLTRWGFSCAREYTKCDGGVAVELEGEFVKFEDLAALPSASTNTDYAAAHRALKEYHDEITVEESNITDFSCWLQLRLNPTKASNSE